MVRVAEEVVAHALHLRRRPQDPHVMAIEQWSVSDGPFEPGSIDDERLDRGLIPLRRRRPARGSVATLSLDEEV